jgi:hypothetical protein
MSTSTSEIDTKRTVSFWMKNLTEVPIRSFPKIEVPSVIQFEAQGLKNKVVKTQGLKMCLTLFLIKNLFVTPRILRYWIKYLLRPDNNAKEQIWIFMKINFYLLKNLYSFNLIKVQTIFKLWNNGNRVKRTPFLLIQKSECLSRSPLATL